jgi:hypothetical protein
MCICDIHGPVCTSKIPDGLHDKRETHKAKPHSKVEYRNGWEIGFYGWPPGLDWESPAIWITKEMGHPIKNPFEVEQEWQNQKFIEDNKKRVIREIETIDQLNCNGGGSI